MLKNGRKGWKSVSSKERFPQLSTPCQTYLTATWLKSYPRRKPQLSRHSEHNSFGGSVTWGSGSYLRSHQLGYLTVGQSYRGFLTGQLTYTRLYSRMSSLLRLNGNSARSTLSE